MQMQKPSKIASLHNSQDDKQWQSFNKTTFNLPDPNKRGSPSHIHLPYYSITKLHYYNHYNRAQTTSKYTQPQQI